MTQQKLERRSGVVLLAGDDASTLALFHRLDAEIGVDAALIEDTVPRSEFIKRRIKRLGFIKVMGQVVFQFGILPWLRMCAERRRCEIAAESRLSLAPIPEAKLVRVPSANSAQTEELLRQLKPSVVVINGTRILTERTLKVVEVPFLNTHVGVTPLYRGVHGGYWALAQRQPEHCGVTIHRVDKGIDTGSIVAQAVIKPTRADNFSTYPWLQMAAGIPLMIVAVREALAGRVAAVAPPPGKSRLWTHPTACEYLWRRLQMGVR